MNSVTKNIIDTSEYQIGYDEGYQACIKNYKKRKEKRNAELRRARYFMKQKAIGFLLIVATVLAVWLLLDGDATIALVTIPLGLTLMFTKEKYWMDDYFYETENKE
ncbi:MAG: hypothetical protein KH921_07090 [Erysipelotrichaceae bacterium]|nr:hypothetical protein [Erysipelotrichaceae bacterium]